MAQKERFSRESAREALIETGRRLLRERGVEAGLDRLSLNDVIVASGVPRASAYRIFSNQELEPQAAFRMAVLAEIIDGYEAAPEAANEAMALLELDDPEGDPVERAKVLREIIRCWSRDALEANRNHPELRLLEASEAVVAHDPMPSEVAIAAHRRSLERSHAAYMPLYVALCEHFGLRPKPGTTFHQLTSMVRAVATTASREWTLQTETRELLRPTGPGGTQQPWSLSGLLIEGIVLTTLEQDPGAANPADLGSWTTS